MSRIREENRADRYLYLRGRVWQYSRKIPLDVADLDSRGSFIRFSLKTSDLAKAMALRDIHERADNDYWASLIAGGDADVAMRRYKAAVARATALGFTYRSAADIAAYEPVDAIVQRIEVAATKPKGSPERVAVYGLAGDADYNISSAIDFYVNTISRAAIRGKSKEQKRIWENIKRAPVAIFIELCGDKKMSEITRDDAHKVYNFWLNRVAPESGRASHSASIANKHMDGLRGLIRDWNKHHGKADAPNPFDGLRFAEKKSQKRKRPPFSVKWVSEKFLAGNGLAGLNRDARGILLAMVETGARLSEICNLLPENIVLDGDYPHIVIEPSDDPDEPREIKTFSSIRSVPLVGVSLAVMKKHKRGFPRYRDRGSSLSGTINKYLRENQLLETPNHTVYSLRHMFEDRMKDGRLDTELRMMLMGHSIDRPDYGEGGSMKWKHEELSKIALSFDPSVL